MGEVWDIRPGERLSRRVRAARFGGARLGGIQPSNTTPNVFLYSDPEASGLIYPYDGWAENDAVFLYTGEGRLGDQEMKAGNRAILEHEQHERALRLFVAAGVIPGTAAKDHTYVGEFRVDPTKPYVRAPAPDDNGEDRNVFVFRLLPVGSADVRGEDRSGTGDAPSTLNAELVAPQQHNAPTYETSGTEPTTAARREAELVLRFEAMLRAEGHGIKRWRIRPPGELMPLMTDTYDETAKELFEAKGTTVRNSVRLAIGQLLDYRRHIDEPNLRLAVLLPSRPSDDLLDLVSSVGMACVYEDGRGVFERVPASD